MAFIADAVFDNGLSYADTNGTRIDICTQEPVTYTEATATAGTAGQFSVGNAAVNTGAPQAGDIDGRKVVVPSIGSGTVTATGTATHWALTDGTSVLIATGALSASQAVTSGNTFTLDAIDITIRDAT